METVAPRVATASLEVFGNRAGSPGPDGPASGYLLRGGGKTVLVDCGPGVLAGLASADVIGELDAVIISHRHADHSADLPSFGYHRAFPAPQPPLPLYAPTGFGEYIEALDRVHGIPTLDDLRTPITSQVRLHEVRPGETFWAAGIQVDTVEAKHPVPCISMRFPDFGFVYTADTAKTDNLVELARGARLLLAEATYVSGDGYDFDAHGHMSGFEAGELAEEAGVERLVLTHLADYRYALETSANASSRYGGTIELARVGQSFEL